MPLSPDTAWYRFLAALGVAPGGSVGIVVRSVGAWNQGALKPGALNQGGLNQGEWIGRFASTGRDGRSREPE